MTSTYASIWTKRRSFAFAAKYLTSQVAKQIIARISMTTQDFLGSPRKNTRISSTVLATSKGFKIMGTIAKIESDTGQQARRQWKKLFPREGGIRVVL